MRRPTIAANALAVLCSTLCGLWLTLAPAQAQQNPSATSPCDPITQLMKLQTPPPLMFKGGGQLKDFLAQADPSTLTSGDNGDRWIFDADANKPLSFTLTARNLQDAVPRVSITYGVKNEVLSPTQGNIYEYTPPTPGVYTLSVSFWLSDGNPAQGGNYKISLAPGQAVRAASIVGIAQQDRQRGAQTSLTPTLPQKEGAQEFNTPSGTKVHANLGVVDLITSFVGAASDELGLIGRSVRYPTRLGSQPRFEVFALDGTLTLLSGESFIYVDNIEALTGVDLVAQPGGAPVKQMKIGSRAKTFAGLDLTVEDLWPWSPGVKTAQINGLWIVPGCAGFRFNNGNEQNPVTTMTTDADTLTLKTEPSGAFRFDMARPNVIGMTIADSLSLIKSLDMRGPLASFVLRTNNGDKQFETDYKNMRLRNRPAPEAGKKPGQDIRLIDRPGTLTEDTWNKDPEQVAIVTDWETLDALRIKTIDGKRQVVVCFGAEQAPPCTGRQITRSAVQLSNIDAMNEQPSGDVQTVTRLLYRDAPGAEARQRLLLPASEDFIEIVTPAGGLLFTPTALPTAPIGTGYRPTGLNNTGAECYPLQLDFPFKCSANGHFNPANGNLFYAITDFAMPGQALNATFARSYNSARANQPGMLGYGWSSDWDIDYGFDYTVPLDRTETRTVSDPADYKYAPAFDLRWVPYGRVFLRTGSGSLHEFRLSPRSAPGDMYVSDTMPRWTIRQDNLNANWLLVIDDGTTYEYDRAGRLHTITRQNETLTVKRQNLDKPDQDGNKRIITVTDTYKRTMRLFFDERMLLRAAELRDELGKALALTRYTYAQQDNRDVLVGVDYGNNTAATYQYDGLYLSGHDDPRAPVARKMIYRISDEQKRVVCGDVQYMACSTVVVGNREFIQETYDRSSLYESAIGNRYGAVQRFSFEPGDVPARQPADPDPRNFRLKRWEVANTGEAWEFGYDAASRLNAIKRKAGQSDAGQIITVSGYNSLGDPRTMGGAMANFAAVYDNANRLTDFIEGSQTVLQFTYPDATSRQVAEITRPGVGSPIAIKNDSATLSIRQGDEPLFSLASSEQWTGRVTLNGAEITRDGFGRVVSFKGTRGLYKLTYTPQYADRNGERRLEVILDGPAGEKHLLYYDERGLLRESCLMACDGSASLRRSTYDYDAWGELTIQTDWNGTVNFTTRYEYEAAPVIAPPPPTSTPAPSARATAAATDAAAPVAPFECQPVIPPGAYTIRETDPAGRFAEVTYDSVQRVLRTLDLTGRQTIYRYDYEANNLKITSCQIGSAQLPTVYTFNSSYQLIAVEEGYDAVNRKATGRSWYFNYAPPPTTPDALPSYLVRTMDVLEPGQGRLQVIWDYNSRKAAGLPDAVTIISTSYATGQNGELRPDKQTQRYEYTYDDQDRIKRVTFRGNSDKVPSIIEMSYATGEAEKMGDALGVNCSAPVSDPLQRINVVTRKMLDQQITVVTDLEDSVLCVDEGGKRISRFSYGPGQNPGERLVQETSSADGKEITQRFVYDAAGQLIRWMDDYKTVSYKYDGLGRLTRVELPGQPLYTYRYFGKTNWLEEAERYDGLKQRYVYDGQGLLLIQIESRDGVSNTTRYSYDSQRRLTSITSPSGRTFAIDYDAQGRVKLFKTPGGTDNYTWQLDNVIEHKDPLGRITTYEFDTAGRLVRAVPGSLYNDGKPPTRLPANIPAYEWQYAFDGLLQGWRVPAASTSNDKTVNPGLTRLLANDARQYNGLVLPNGQTAYSFAYDPAGRLTQLTASPDGTREIPVDLTYDPVGRLTQFGPVGFNYDFTKKTLTVDDGLTTTWTFDELYQARSMARGKDTTSYDWIDNGFRISYPSGHTQQCTREADAQQRQNTLLTCRWYAPGVDPSSKAAISFYAARYLFSAEHQLIGITEDVIPPNAAKPGSTPATAAPFHVTRSAQISYNAQGLPSQVTNFSGGSSVFAYDGNGNLILYTDPGGNSYTYRYDGFNRLQEIQTPLQQTVRLDYNDAGQLVRIKLLDAARQESVIDAYGYDLQGFLNQRGVPDQYTINYTRNNQGQVEAIQIGDKDKLTLIYGGNDPAGRLKEIRGQYGANRFGWTNTYDPPDKPTPRTTTIQQDEGPVDPINAIYAIDSAGRVTSAGNLKYTYSPDGSLTISGPNAARLTYTMDASLFVKQMSLGNIQIDFSYGAPSQGAIKITGRRRPSGEAFSYDTDSEGRLVLTEFQAAGLPNAGKFIVNLSNQGVPLGIDDAYEGTTVRTSISYDALQRITGISAIDSFDYAFRDSAEITYDSFGNRQRVRVIQNGGGQVVDTYVYDPAGRLITRTRAEQAKTASTAALYLAPLPFGLMLIRRWSRRRYARLVGLLVLVFIFYSAGVTFAQGNVVENKSEYRYTYNSLGSLETVTQKVNDQEIRVARYGYDPLNRLISAELSNFDAGQATITYTYDAYGSVVGYKAERNNQPPIQQAYTLNGQTPLFVTTPGQKDTAILGYVNPQYPPIANRSGDAVYNLYDPLGSLRQTVVENQMAGTAANFTPFGEPIPAPPGNPDTGPERVDVLQPGFGGMRWDPIAHLYIGTGGRAYAPEIGLYLQPDPLGPDATGNLYQYRANRANLPVARQSRTITSGLRMFDQLVGYRGLVDSLWADNIRAAQMPTPVGVWRYTALDDLRAYSAVQFQAAAAMQYLPQWLSQQYNWSGVSLNGSQFQFGPYYGAGQNAAQRTLPASFDLFSAGHAPALRPPTTALAEWQRVQTGLDRAGSLLVMPTWYRADAWRPQTTITATVNVPNLFDPRTGQLTVPAPNTVYSWLPNKPIDLATTIRMLKGADQMPPAPFNALLDQVYHAMLPVTPVVPSADPVAALTPYLSRDTFPTWGQLRGIGQFPEPPSAVLPQPGKVNGPRLQVRDTMYLPPEHNQIVPQAKREQSHQDDPSYP
ncbi:MAG: hypothetical protein IT324_27380 [Anaerolineae bacterium]|nr:hypothetical protein [Anaerolineae bacterium]